MFSLFMSRTLFLDSQMLSTLISTSKNLKLTVIVARYFEVQPGKFRLKLENHSPNEAQFHLLVFIEGNLAVSNLPEGIVSN